MRPRSERGPFTLRVIDFVERLAGDPWLRLALFAGLALAAVWPLFPGAASLNEFRDAHVLQAYEQDAREAVVRYGQLPLWDPYYCGGMYALGTPQSRFAAPPFLLTILLGAQRAQPVIAFAMMVLGMEGAFRYFLRRARTPLGPLLAAPLIALNGMFAVSFFNGWINFYGFELIPWVLYGASLAGAGNARGVIVTALAFAFIVGFGGTYAAPMAALFAVLEIVRSAIEHRRDFVRAIPVVAAAGVLSLGASAFRLWPIWETLAAAPRIMAGTPKNGWDTLVMTLIEPATASAGNHGWEGVYYSRAIALLLAPLAIFVPRAIPAAALGGLALWAATGYAGSTPFTWLRELPVFSTFRYPERFLFFSCLFAAELAAVAVALLMRARPRALAVLLMLGVLAVFGVSYEAMVAHQQLAVQGMTLAPPPLRASEEFRQARGNRWLAAYYAPLNRGSLSCWEAYPVPQSEKLRGDLARDEYALDPDAGSVERLRWSPNRLDLRVELTRESRVLVNQNWHPGWRSNVGRVVDHEGLLAVDLPEGESRVRLWFLPRSAIGGALVSLASLVAAVAFLFLRRGRLSRRRLGTWLLVAAPLPVFGLAWLIPERPYKAPRYTNADGQAAIVNVVPQDATPLAVQYELPVELVGARVHSSSDLRADVELYWRVSGRLPKTVGVFAQLVGPGGTTLDAHHLAVASSFYLADAPRGRIIRDAFSVHLSRLPRGQHSLRVGLWHAATQGPSVGVKSAGGAELVEDRVTVGSVDRQ